MGYEDISSKLQDIIDELNDSQVLNEEQLRDEFPALRDLWEKYQATLKLCKDSKPKPKPAAHGNVANLLARMRARK